MKVYSAPELEEVKYSTDDTLVVSKDNTGVDSASQLLP